VCAAVLKKIRVSELTLGMFIHGLDAAWLDHPFWRSKFLIKDTETLQKIRKCGVQHCWIDVSQGQDIALPAALATHEPAAASTPPASRAERASLADELERAAQIRERCVETMRSLYAEVRLGKAIQQEACLPLVDEVFDSIQRNHDALCSLVRLKTADEYTYMHSVAVCALMVALGRQLGFDDAQCRVAGLAGMLHDLGKALMPQEILNKPGKLTPEEFDIIKTHPRRGYELLIAGNSNTLDPGVGDVCLHHHERFDGTGYPDKLSAEGISLLARMGAICDCYDAVTSDRPYKAGWDPAHALSQMATWKGHFDTSLFQAFVKCIGIYPTGSLVRLRSGRLAVVVEQNPKTLTKPQVKFFFSTKSGMPLRPELLDLSRSDCRDEIDCREPAEKWQFSYLNELWGGVEAAAKN
jgi:HD-GYP domain-containing protein (c-di-GMP phosphodiesterase class II)